MQDQNKLGVIFQINKSIFRQSILAFGNHGSMWIYGSISKNRAHANKTSRSFRCAQFVLQFRVPPSGTSMPEWLHASVADSFAHLSQQRVAPGARHRRSQCRRCTLVGWVGLCSGCHRRRQLRQQPRGLARLR